MNSIVKVSTIYHCSLERAFKTPMLSEISKVHTGYGVFLRVTHCTDDYNWGKPGFSKKVFTAPSFLQKGGWAFNDTVIERMENQYWKIEVGDFRLPMFGITKFVGEWKTTELGPNKILVEYSYEVHSSSVFLYPLHWLFAKSFWKTYMKQVLENIRTMTLNKEPYLFD